MQHVLPNCWPSTHDINTSALDQVEFILNRFFCNHLVVLPSAGSNTPLPAEYPTSHVDKKLPSSSDHVPAATPTARAIVIREEARKPASYTLHQEAHMFRTTGERWCRLLLKGLIVSTTNPHKFFG
ncbi:hypothetical protein TWF694_009816 [Orbilia ellipsospora]|uniref:Uncharacterized protein n=1 Tax=Orbilia ellipsospora TaxID=2528407 RepID=A0AAV9XDB6_9PEZI